VTERRGFRLAGLWPANLNGINDFTALLDGLRAFPPTAGRIDGEPECCNRLLTKLEKFVDLLSGRKGRINTAVRERGLSMSIRGY
jgi:hypothetical protein